MNYRELFRVEDLPVFQNKMFPDRETAINCSKGDVVLVQDMNTGLIFNAAFDPALLEYDKDYQNEQAHSGVFQQHLAEVKAIISRYFYDKTLIEVGCGKGYFLEYLNNAGYDIIGIDPAYEGSNPNVIKACFKASLGLDADGIVLRHVLEHVPDPYSFLKKIAEANGNKGKIYIEVPCFDWICQHRAWFDVYYEHVNYFRLADFYRMFDKIDDRGHIFGGQYLYVVADLDSLKEPKQGEGDIFEFPGDFLSGINVIVKSAKGRKNVIWGGSSKGVIFSLYLLRQSVNIDYVIDINPAKQGKYLCGSGLQVVSPERAMQGLDHGDDIFVMNSIYLDEIKILSSNQFNYIKVD